MAILRSAPLLRQFLAVVNEGSLTAAAQKVSVTQSALTKSMRKLEQALGAPLFERLPRGIALTVYGKTLLPHAQRIVAECRLADLELQAFGSGQRLHGSHAKDRALQSEDPHGVRQHRCQRDDGVAVVDLCFDLEDREPRKPVHHTSQARTKPDV